MYLPPTAIAATAIRAILSSSLRLRECLCIIIKLEIKTKYNFSCLSRLRYIAKFLLTWYTIEMDFAFIHQVIPLYVSAAWLTLRAAAAGIVLSVFVGLACAVIRFWKVPVLSALVKVYTELSRNTPLLIQLFFLYFALPKMGIKLSSMQCGVIGLTFLGGSYMAETFRSAFGTVSSIQIESGQCIGLTHFQIAQYVILPQAVAVSIPGVCANIMFLIKETSMFSAVALADLMYVAKDLIGLYYKTDEALFLLVIAYFVLLLPISILSWWMEKRLRYGQFGAK